MNTEVVRFAQVGAGQRTALGVVGDRWAAVLATPPTLSEAQTIQHYLGGEVVK